MIVKNGCQVANLLTCFSVVCSMSELDPVALVNDPSGCGLVPVGHISRQMFQHTLQQQSVMVDRLLRPQAVHALKPRLVAASALQHPYIAPVIGGSLEFGGAVVYGVAQVCY